MRLTTTHLGDALMRVEAVRDELSDKGNDALADDLDQASKSLHLHSEELLEKARRQRDMNEQLKDLEQRLEKITEKLMEKDNEA